VEKHVENFLETLRHAQGDTICDIIIIKVVLLIIGKI